MMYLNLQELLIVVGIVGLIQKILGKEINTSDDDWGYKISTDGELAYFQKLHLIEKMMIYFI